MALLTEAEKIDRIRLFMSDNIGPITFNQLLSFYGSASEAIKNIHNLAQRGGRKKPYEIASVEKAEKQCQIAQDVGARIIFQKEEGYPKLLNMISDAPPLLFVKGNLDVFQKPGFAIVGTRNASVNGKNMARNFARIISQKGYNIVSGMARGIDRAAHIGAMENENEALTTTAILGTPVDEVYPAENSDIYQKISEKGCLVSEFPFGTPLSPRNFPRRNRIISGICLGTLVIEAQKMSGSLITAREAASQGRDVFAVPGSPVDPRSSGPNALIQDGATMVCQPEDILNVLDRIHEFHLSEKENNMKNYESSPLNEQELDEVRTTLMMNLGPDITSVDTLIEETGLDARAINIILVELELAGRLERHPGNCVSLLYHAG